MTVIWSGVTEEGAVVPVQVTDEGKVVAVGDGPSGDYLPITGGELTGDLAVDGSITVAGNVEIPGDGSITAASGIISKGDASGGGADGSIMDRDNGFSASYSNAASLIYRGYTTGNSTPTFSVSCDGSITAAGDIDCGNQIRLNPAERGISLTAGGELFLSRPNTSGLIYGYRTGEVGVKFQLSNDGSITAAGGKCGFTSGGEIVFTSRGARYKLVVQGELVVAEPYTRQMELKEKAEQFIADKRETKPSDPGDPSPY